MLNAIWRDLRYAARGLAQTPAFTATAVITVAVGIAGPSLIFSLANWTLFRPVPGVSEPERVGAIASATFRETSYAPARIDYGDYFELRRSLKTLDLAGHQTSGVIVSTAQRPARTLLADFVTASYLRVLGTRMIIGRAFADEEDVPGSPVQAAVISERTWDALFARSPDVLTQTLNVNGQVFSIIGVTGNGFGGTLRTQAIDLWLPGATYYPVNRMSPRPGGPPAPGYAAFIGRLREDASWSQASAELQNVAGWLLARDAARYTNFKTASVRVDGPIGHSPFFRNNTVTWLLLMLAGTAILLLIACSNVATMMLARNSARHGEIAVRRALGGTMANILRQRIAEGVLVCVAGGAIALLVVFATTQIIDGFTLLGERREGGEVPIDWRLVAFTAALAVTTGILSSLVPGLNAARVNPAAVLQANAPTHTARNRMAIAFTGIQLSASLALLVGAFLLTASVWNLSNVDLGFDPARTHVTRLNLRPAGYRGTAAAEFIREYLARVAAAPGIEHVAAAQQVPIAAGNFTTAIKPADAPTAKIGAQAVEILSTGYFDALRIPIVSGRAFNDADFTRGPDSPVIISERLAREVFGDANPIGRTLEYWSLNRRGRPYEVIGVAANVQMASIEGEPENAIYEVADTTFADGAFIVVRTAGDADPTGTLQTAAAAMHRDIPVERVEPLTAAIDGQRREWLVLARLMAVVSAVAVLLAGIGLAAVVSAGVSARFRELGIRIALGATPLRIGRFALRRTAFVTAAGLLLGSAGGAALAQLLRNRLFGVTPFDPGVWALAGAGLVLIALVSSWIPVRRAVHLDVARTLRV